MSALSGKDILLAHILGGKREVDPGAASSGIFNTQGAAKLSATLLHDGQAVVGEFFGVVGHAASIVFNVQVDGFVAVLVEVAVHIFPAAVLDRLLRGLGPDSP